MDRHDLGRLRGPAAWSLLLAAAVFPLVGIWAVLLVLTGSAGLFGTTPVLFAHPMGSIFSAVAVVLACYWGSPHARARAIAYVAVTIQSVSLAMGLLGGVLEFGFRTNFITDPYDGLLAQLVNSGSVPDIFIKLSALAALTAALLMTLPAVGVRLEPAMRLSYTPLQGQADPDSSIDFEVSALTTLDAHLDKIHRAAGEWPHPVEVLLYPLDGEDGIRSLRVAIGRDTSVVEWEREQPEDDGKWSVQERFLSWNGGTDNEPYLMVGGHGAGPEPARCPAWEVVPIADARDAVRRFFRTGQRPDNLTWRDETPAPDKTN